jgi:hypothetical protein
MLVQEFLPLITDLSCKSKHILEAPYDAQAWYARSGVLTRLGYPELAAGDAYKALLLVLATCKETAKDTQRTWPAGEADFISAMEEPCSRQCNDSSLHLELQKHLLAPDHAELAQLDQAILNGLLEALVFSNAAFHALRMSIVATARYLEHDWFCKSRAWLQGLYKGKRRNLIYTRSMVTSNDEFDYQIRIRDTVRRVYPWMKVQQYQRAPEVINTVAGEVGKASGNCNVGASSARKSIKKRLRVVTLNEVDVVRVFAKREISRGEIVLVDEMGLSAANVTSLCNNCCSSLKAMKPVKLPCCDVDFCSTKCAQDAGAR